MPIDRFFIKPFSNTSGIRKDTKPFLIPDEAFAELNNAYVFRGRVRKRFGSTWLGGDTATQFSTRLRVKIGTTDAGGDLAGNVRTLTSDATLPLMVGQMFSVGTQIYTVITAGAVQAMAFTGASLPSSFSTTNGDFDIDSSDFPLTDVYFYPSLPVMGLVEFETNAFEDEPLVAFDTNFAYQFISPTGWERLNLETTTGASVWTGSNSQFFWGASYNGANAYDYDLFVTNFNESEPNYMRVLPNTTLTWDNFRPLITAANYLDMARIIIPFKNRLLAFNTWENEGGTQRHYPFRMRYSQVGSAIAVDAWRSDIPGKGSALDFPTNEAITTVEFLNDRLIVYLERSTWEVAFTGNQIYPFEFQQINPELGAESTFSVIALEQLAIGVGNVGIQASTSNRVERIDSSIPDEVFDIHNLDDGIERVYGIRDYFVENLYWTFPDQDTTDNFPFPSKILVYNYKTGTWALNDDSITAFGYFQPTTGTTWNSTVITWDDPVSWDSGFIQAKERTVIAGNPSGWTFLIEPDVTVNAPAMYITNITVTVAGSNVITIGSINHNLRTGQYVYFQDIQQESGNLTLFNGKIFPVIVDDSTPNSFTFLYSDPLGSIIAGEYAGGGVMARVSQIDILTKQYNFYADKGRNAYVSKVDFQVDATTDGEIQIDYFVSTNANSMVEDAAPITGTGALLGTSVLETFPYPTVPFEAASTQLWHPIYISADGEYIQLRLYLNDTEMRDPLIRKSDFQLNHIIFSAQPTSSRLQ